MPAAFRRPLLFLPLLALSGCGLFTPFESPPPPAPANSTDTMIGVCYSGVASSEAQVRAVAEHQCPSHKLRRVDSEWNLDACPMLTPARAIFACAAP